MNYRKLFLMVFLASTGLWQTACLPINFAQSPKRTANQAAENKGQEISVSGKSPFGGLAVISFTVFRKNLDR